ncbi:unnamed protein product [Chilo suppressalis]|uniref:CCHC-type domain-containing protein n=1 Tax=Chilo suppressalis TaxID=168631 RepID=A0ABN8B514_CHISP|nr:unnamed protein product [Chilo suppressalis]
MLKLPRGKAPIPVQPQGPAVIFYLAVESLKSSEDTKRHAIKPGTEGIRIQSVRMVDKSGVVVRTANLEAAQKLKAAAPPSLKAADPKTHIRVIGIDDAVTTEVLVQALAKAGDCPAHQIKTMSSSEGGKPPPNVFRPRASLQRTPPGGRSQDVPPRTPSPPQYRTIMESAADISAKMSSSEEGGPPPKEPFAPRKSLMRTPPGRFAAPARSQGAVDAELVASAVYRAVVASLSPGASPSACVSAPQPSLAQVPSYANMLKLPRGKAPIPVQPQGPAVIFYPADESLKSSEDTKRTLQNAIKPGSEGIRIQSVRMVGKSGVVVRTANLEAAQQLKAAAPPSLKAADPKTRLPRIALRFLRSDISEEDFLVDLQKVNLSDDPEWSLDKVKQSCKVALKKEVGTKFLYILECTMPMRDKLIRLGKVYIGWDEAEVSDHARATCCLRCQQYGHPEKYCRAKEMVCGKCGDVGHKATECQAKTQCCATCRRMSGSEGGPPPSNIFRPRSSLQRTPPGRAAPLRTPSPPPHRTIMESAADISSAVYDAVMASLSPGPSPPPPPSTPKTPVAMRESAKRMLSPDEWTKVVHPKRRQQAKVRQHVVITTCFLG